MRGMLIAVALASSAGDAMASAQTTDYCLTEDVDAMAGGGGTFPLGKFIMKARLVITGSHFVLDAWNVMPDISQTLEIHADGTYRPKGPTPIRFIDNWDNRGRGNFIATKSTFHIDIDTVKTSHGDTNVSRNTNIGRNYGAFDLTSHHCKWDRQ